MMTDEFPHTQLFIPCTDTIDVLVVDDYPAVADMVCRTLEAVGCDVWLADSGETALELIPEHSWDVLVTDLNMPGISGLELLRRRDAHLPAILMSAEAITDIRFELKALDAAWLKKPFSAAQLIELVMSRAQREHDLAG
jgi:CheY-like chemotaxis protein